MSAHLNAGDLRERITIQQEARTSNGQGGFTATWSDLGKAWARVIGLTGTEALKSGVERNVQQWRVITRYRSDVTAKNRILWNGLTLNVKAVMPDPDNPRAATILMCESAA